MSHRPQRKEKICLNCHASVTGKFCQDCGQENVEPHETVWHLIQHFLSDLTHFDGKLWHTAKLLIARPGLLSQEYIKGRRARYVNPVNLYLFSSAIFFLIFFSIFNNSESNLKVGVRREAIDKMDSTELDQFTRDYNKGKPMTKEAFLKKIDSSSFTSFLGNYSSREQYDSALKAGKKHNWLEKQIVYKLIESNKKYKNDTHELGKTLIEKFRHSFPQMIFVLLPIFAFYLKILYNRRKQFLYIDHAIFTLHLYVFTFLGMLVILLINKLNSSLHWSLLSVISFAGFLGMLFYFYKALRNYYHQGRFKTVIKYILMLVLSLVTIIVLFLLFLMLSFFQI